MTDKELIKQEIERRIKNLEFSLENNCVEKYSKLDILGNITTLKSLLQFIDSLSEEPTSEDLDYLVISLEETIGTSPHSREVIKEHLQRAAEWQKQRMMKDAVGGVVHHFADDELAAVQQKQLLLQDLSARLPYGVKLLYNSNSIAKIKDRIEILRGITIGYTIWFETNYNHSEYDSTSGSYEHFKPYLRPMSSMTEEEKEEFNELTTCGRYCNDYDSWGHWGPEVVSYRYDELDKPVYDFSQFQNLQNWLNKKHLDYLGLIPMGLALEAPEGMYN